MGMLNLDAEFSTKILANWATELLIIQHAAHHLRWGGGLKAPKGGHRRLPHFGKAVEEGKNTKGMNPRQETVPRLPSGVAECGKHKQRKVGGLEAPQSSLEASKSRLEAPKSRPGGSKIELWGLQNPVQSPPRRHF